MRYVHVDPSKVPFSEEIMKQDLPLLAMLYEAQERDAITIKEVYQNNLTYDVCAKIHIETLYPDTHIAQLTKYLESTWDAKVYRIGMRELHITTARIQTKKEELNKEVIRRLYDSL